MNDKEYLEKIKAALKERKITQKELARTLGKSESWINDILRGNYPYREAWACPLYLSKWANSNLFGLWHTDDEWIDYGGHQIPKL